MSQKGQNIQKQDKHFAEAYFSKVFSTELSAAEQEHMTNEEKLQNLERLYQYAKSRELPKSLLQNLLHEILTLTIKVDDYREDFFNDYLANPLESNGFLKIEKVQ